MKPPTTTSQSSTAQARLADSATTDVVGKPTVIKSVAATPLESAAMRPGEMTTQMANLADIRIDGGTQTRAEINDDTVAQYMEAMQAKAQFPAIILYDDGKVLWLADGFHRHRAADRLGRLKILAEVRGGTRLDAIEHALKANNSHGLRRTNADKARCVEVALEHFRDRSDRALAELCGVSHPFVAGLRPQLETVTSSSPGNLTGEVPPSTTAEKRIGKDNKARKNPTRGVKAAPKTPGDTKNPPDELLPTTPENPTTGVLTEPIRPTTVTVPEPEGGPDADAKEQPTPPAPAGEKYTVADGSSANLPTEGFLTAAHLTCGLGKLKIVAKQLDGGKVSSALVSKLERGFLKIMAAVFEIAGADADQADKDGVVEILRSVANTIETAS